MSREELAAVLDLLTAIRDALEDLPVRDDGNATARWAAAYCNAENAAAWVGLAVEGKLPAVDSLTERLAGYANQIRQSLAAQATEPGAAGDREPSASPPGEAAETCPKCGAPGMPLRPDGRDAAGVLCLSCGPVCINAGQVKP